MILRKRIGAYLAKFRVSRLVQEVAHAGAYKGWKIAQKSHCTTYKLKSCLRILGDPCNMRIAQIDK